MYSEYWMIILDLDPLEDQDPLFEGLCSDHRASLPESCDHMKVLLMDRTSG